MAMYMSCRCSVQTLDHTLAHRIFASLKGVWLTCLDASEHSNKSWTSIEHGTCLLEEISQPGLLLTHGGQVCWEEISLEDLLTCLAESRMSIFLYLTVPKKVTYATSTAVLSNSTRTVAPLNNLLC